VISGAKCAREIAPALWESMGSMRRYGSTALQFYELYHRKHDSIAALIEGGGAYGSMTLLEPITSYLATGGFPDVTSKGIITGPALRVEAFSGVFRRFFALFGVVQRHNQNVKSLMYERSGS
jgi:hypothetical protein